MPKSFTDFTPIAAIDKNRHYFRSLSAIEARKNKNNTAWILKQYNPDHPLSPKLEVLAAELWG